MPARGYSWPPFGAGNEAALTHGASSIRTRAVRQRAEAIFSALRSDYPFIAASDFEQVQRYCRVAARAELLNEFVFAVAAGEREARRRVRGAPTTGVEGVPPHLWTEVTRAEALAGKLWQDLGGDPTGRWKLLKDAGWAKHLAGDRMDGLMKKGRELRERRLRALPDPSTDENEGTDHG